MKIDAGIKGECGIYVIKNKINDKIYIGSSKNIYNRLMKHRALLRPNKHKNLYLQNAWNKYGEKNFEYYILETCKFENLLKREQHYINILNPKYNIALKVERTTLDDSIKKQISETLKRLYREGMPLTKTREVYVYNLNGAFISKYSTIEECAKEFGCHRSSIDNVLYNHRDRFQNYIFSYEKKEIKRIYKKYILIDYINKIYYNCDNIKDFEKFTNIKPKNLEAPLYRGHLYKKQYQIIYTFAREKLDELLENLEEGNQQPSSELNAL